MRCLKSHLLKLRCDLYISLQHVKSPVILAFQINHISVGDSPLSAAYKGFPEISPHGGVDRHQPVIFWCARKEHEQIGNGEQAVSKGVLYDRGVALIINARGIGIFFVEFPAELRGELFAGMVAVGAVMSGVCEGVILKRGVKTVDTVRKAVQDIQKLRAAVGR